MIETHNPKPSFSLRLSSQPVTDNDGNYKLPAIAADNKATGHWTMISDEGFHVTVDAKSGETREMSALFKYVRLKEGCEGKEIGNDDNVDAQGKTLCYATNPTETHIGWYRDVPKSAGQTKFGCFYAKAKTSNANSLKG